MTCSMSRSIWALAPEDFVEKVIASQEEDPKAWLFTLHEKLDTEEFTRLVVTTWAIWGARRKAIHEAEFQSPMSTHLFIQRFIDDLALIETPRRHTQTSSVIARSVCDPWVPPTAGFSKINVDAVVSSHQGRGSAAALCKDERGMFLGASAMVYPLTDPPTLETLACRRLYLWLWI